MPWIASTQASTSAAALVPSPYVTFTRSATKPALKWMSTPTTSTYKWWDGAALQSATLLGWWNGTSVQPVKVLGWWDGTAIQPIKAP